MFLITAIDATSTTARFRMPVLRSEWVSGASMRDHCVAGAVPFGFGYGVDTKAPFTGAAQGVRAWSPPV